MSTEDSQNAQVSPRTPATDGRYTDYERQLHGLYEQTNMMEHHPEFPQMVIGEDRGQPLARDESKRRQHINRVTEVAQVNPHDAVVGEAIRQHMDRSTLSPGQFGGLVISPNPMSAGGNYYNPSHGGTLGAAGRYVPGAPMTGSIDVGYGYHPTKETLSERLGLLTLHETGHHLDDQTSKLSWSSPTPVVGMRAKGEAEGIADRTALEHWQPGPQDSPTAVGDGVSARYMRPNAVFNTYQAGYNFLHPQEQLDAQRAASEGYWSKVGQVPVEKMSPPAHREVPGQMTLPYER